MLKIEMDAPHMGDFSINIPSYHNMEVLGYACLYSDIIFLFILIKIMELCIAPHTKMSQA